MAGSSTHKAEAQTTSSVQAKWFNDLQKQLGAQTAAMSNTIAPMQAEMNAGGYAPTNSIWNQAPPIPIQPAQFSNLPGGTGRVDPAGSGNNGGNGGGALNNVPSGGMGQL